MDKVDEAVAKGEYIKPSDSAEKVVYRLEVLLSYVDALAVDNGATYGGVLTINWHHRSMVPIGYG